MTIKVKDGYALMALICTNGGTLCAIIYRDNVRDYVVCYGYNIADGTWAQGHYTGKRYKDALNELKTYM